MAPQTPQARSVARTNTFASQQPLIQLDFALLNRQLCHGTNLFRRLDSCQVTRLSKVQLSTNDAASAHADDNSNPPSSRERDTRQGAEPWRSRRSRIDQIDQGGHKEQGHGGLSQMVRRRPQGLLLSTGIASSSEMPVPFHDYRQSFDHAQALLVLPDDFFTHLLECFQSELASDFTYAACRRFRFESTISQLANSFTSVGGLGMVILMASRLVFEIVATPQFSP
ncbi:hypothetical protein IWZ03DRAFT_410085 [Phyllosticta citriasiana]|uniref:Uncharacterized protein n=1 Tax=Phyllosticta citriasiana TaxID=595635 RepID=A0ABR1K874_9PEZI